VVSDTSGNIAIVMALIAPVLLGFAGAGFDFARYRSAQGDLQEIADMSALAGAREFVIKADGSALSVAVAQEVVDKTLASSLISASANVTGDPYEKSVTVEITREMTPSLFVGMFKNPLTIVVDATAQAMGGANICVIGLDAAAPGVVKVENNAMLSGGDCAVYSNSVHITGLSSIDSGMIDTALNCSAGGYGGSAGANFKPAPVTDCPVKADPLALRAEPVVGACSPVPNIVSGTVTTIMPGVYCGGLLIDGAADVTMEPGVYVMKDGDLTITSTARVTGVRVGIFFEGVDSVLTVDQDVTLSLSAPETGEMAGILVFQDREADPGRQFTISSNNAETLVGTIYLPNGRLFIDATAPVAGASAYTAIIAERLELSSSVSLVLNSDYGATNVPVPDGLVNAGSSVRLRE